MAEVLFESLACNTLALKKGGNATELACIKLLQRCGYNVEDTRNKYMGEGKKYTRFFFDSLRKKMSTIIEKDSVHVMHTKGAAEQILGSCNTYLEESGTKELTQEIRQQVMDQIDEFNREALRTITVAYRELKPGQFGAAHDEKTPDGKNRAEEEGLTFLCILGIRDTLRAGVPEAVRTCTSAGIRVIMVTGDNVTTARTIAANCGILTSKSGNAVMEGDKFSSLLGGIVKYCTNCDREFSPDDVKKYRESKQRAVPAKSGGKDDDEEDDSEKSQEQEECPNCHKRNVVDRVRRLDKFKEIQPDLCVIARSHPLHKLLLVSALKELYYLSGLARP